jgi:hypothetical protein
MDYETAIQSIEHNLGPDVAEAIKRLLAAGESMRCELEEYQAQYGYSYAEDPCRKWDAALANDKVQRRPAPEPGTTCDEHGRFL